MKQWLSGVWGGGWGINQRLQHFKYTGVEVRDSHGPPQCPPLTTSQILKMLPIPNSAECCRSCLSHSLCPAGVRRTQGARTENTVQVSSWECLWERAEKRGVSRGWPRGLGSQWESKAPFLLIGAALPRAAELDARPPSRLVLVARAAPGSSRQYELHGLGELSSFCSSSFPCLQTSHTWKFPGLEASRALSFSWLDSN